MYNCFILYIRYIYFNSEQVIIFPGNFFCHYYILINWTIVQIIIFFIKSIAIIKIIITIIIVLVHFFVLFFIYTFLIFQNEKKLYLKQLCKHNKSYYLFFLVCILSYILLLYTICLFFFF